MKFEMTERRTFSLPISPTMLSTAQEKGVRIIKSKGGKMFPTFFKKKKVLESERALEVLLLPHRPRKTIANDGDTCVVLTLKYFFPHPAGTPKWKRGEITFMPQRPDADNLSKTVVDVMTSCGFWDDDSMVNFRFDKWRSPDPHIEVIIETWKQEREIKKEQ